MLRLFLHQLLVGPSGMTSAGVPLDLGGATPFLLWAHVKFIVADGDGLRQALQWKGASGLKPCFFHWIVLSKDSDLASRNDMFVEIC